MIVSHRQVLGIAAVVAISGFVLHAASAQTKDQDAHLAIENPADLTKEQAQKHYQSLIRRMSRGYAAAQMDLIRNYQNWPLFNDAP